MGRVKALEAMLLAALAAGCKPKAEIPAAPMPAQAAANLSAALLDLGFDPQTAPSGWSSIQRTREAQRVAYFAANQEAFDAFMTTPLGFDGIPAIVFRLLADVEPDLWGPASFAKNTGFHAGPDGFPLELSRGPAKGQPFTIVSFSCGSCHTGYVYDGSNLLQLVGAPSTTLDIPGYRRKIYQTVTDPRFTPEQFLAVLAKKSPGWLYGAAKAQVEAAEAAGFKAEAQTILTALKQSVVAGETAVQSLLGGYTFHLQPAQLNGGIPGSLDAFGLTAAALFIPANFSSLSLSDQQVTLKTVLPPAAPMVDIMSVWAQGGRNFAQWDGNIKDKLMRNLGAELGVIRETTKVNFANAVTVTPFVNNMPPPPYPFAVDLVKAARGQALYRKTCRGCHDTEAFLPLVQIGTDPNRAQGLTETARQDFIQALRSVCTDATNPSCNVTDDNIMVDRPANPGYLALPLSGIWARAPYLHNGSVPTLYHLLVPGERPATFKRGSPNYDQTKVGFDWQNAGEVYSTSSPGFSNAGHADRATFYGGVDYSRDAAARDDLLEYLKTL